MKIFSIQSKTSLVAWSVVLGLLVGFVLNNHTDLSYCNQDVQSTNPSENQNPALQELTFQEDACMHGLEVRGYPFKYSYVGVTLLPADRQNLEIQIYNFMFWILAVLIILSLIRYFINRSRPDAGTATLK